MQLLMKPLTASDRAGFEPAVNDLLDDYSLVEQASISEWVGILTAVLDLDLDLHYSGGVRLRAVIFQVGIRRLKGDLCHR